MQHLVLVFAAFLALLSGSAAADDWPSRPVQIIAPATPGGAADTFARILTEHVPKFVGGTFMVDNRAGAETQAMTPGQFTTFMASEIEKWAPLAKRVTQKN